MTVTHRPENFIGMLTTLPKIDDSSVSDKVTFRQDALAHGTSKIDC